MHLRKIIITLCLIASLGAKAQQNQVYTFPATYYSRGLELFDEKKYNAAILQFRLFMENSNNASLKSEAEYYLSMSKLYAGHTDGEAAVQRFLESNPGSHKTHMANLALGDYWYLQQKYSKALKYYKEVDPIAISREEQDRFYFRKGYSEVATKKYKDAIETLEPLTNKESEYKILAIYYYAYCNYYVGNYKQALAGFKSIENEPDAPKSIRLYVGTIYYILGEYDKAIKTLDAATGLPADKVALIKGKCYYRLGQYEKAVSEYDKAGIKMTGLDPNEKYEIGYTYYKTGNCSKAITWLREVANTGDSMGQYASYNLADCYLKTGEKRDAVGAFSEAYRTDYNPTIAENALFNHAKLAIELKDGNATSLLNKFIDKYPRSKDIKEARRLQAEMLLTTNNFKDAVAVLEGISDMDDATEESYQRVTLNRGIELSRSYQWNEAIAMYDKCISKKANRTLAGYAYYWKGEALMATKKYNEAGANYNKFLNSPGATSYEYFPLAYYGLGYAKYEEEVQYDKDNIKFEDYDIRGDKWLEAATYFNKFSNSPGVKYDEKILNDAKCREADCYFMAACGGSTTKLDNAVKSYSYVVGKRQEFADYAMFQSGMIYGLQRKRDDKIAILKKIPLDFKKSPYIPDAYFELGEEYKNYNNKKEAEKYFNYVINDYKGNPLLIKCYLSLGNMYYNDNLDDKAVNSYTSLYEEFPNTSDAQRASDMIRRIYYESNRPQQWFDWAEKHKISVASGEKDTAMFQAALDFYDQNRWNDAIKSFDNYNNKMPGGRFAVYAHYYKALCYTALKNNAKAIEEYKYVADANGHDKQEESVLALLDLYGKDAPCEELMPYLQKIEQITKSPETQYRSMRELLRCYVKQKNWNETRSKANQILNVSSAPEDLKSEAKLMIGRCDFEGKNYRSALISFKNCYEGADNFFAAQAKYWEVVTFYTIDSTEACERATYNMIDEFAGYDFWIAKAVVVLGDAYLKAKDEVNAKSTWNAVLENFPKEKEPCDEARAKLLALKNKKTMTNNLIDEGQ